ncbi:MAG: bifunctional riboflavin kinase/FAD synthetase [Planctomycetales bacterium]|nr:bifunctional riboflavin kinase/FAD synthetase [Planctomycetales bacterium]MCA9201981.1 bifunctional riboflavin kinase/FAD synthetase [Planctomycetales bacterium]MCA9209357.1 bifunctional riboflavin kinase/FAD synthetase [Planctomycetales bacterium]
MILLHSLETLDADVRGGALTIGNFDGVHRGHAAIIERLKAQAAKVGGPAVVFTFDPHPVRLLRPEAAPPPLTWTDRKAELLAELGVDAVIAYPTDRALLALTAAEFFQRIVREALAARAVVEGPNFYFGRDRQGNTETLRQFCQDADVALDIVTPIVAGESFISSSRIRDCVARGDVDEARRLLTRPYRIRGLVTHGARRGNTIGFPTANIAAVDTLLPGEGVYAGRAYVDEAVIPAAINIGPNPTFSEQQLKVEAHLLDYSGSLYGRTLEVDFLARLRDTRPFASVDALVQQLQHDVGETRVIAANAT